jgi:hypothetical protein
MNNRKISSLGINYGFLTDKVPQEVLDELKLPIDKLKSNFNLGNRYNDKLIGEVEHEYQINSSPLLKQYIRVISEELDNEIHYVKNNYDTSKNIELSFSELWVNFQKKHEYNPVHYHAGLFSFVIWYQIPYIFEDEWKYSSKQGKDCNHGQFEFVIANPYNNKSNAHCIKLNMDKKLEGYIAIFPSSLNHVVYPFYSSDDYRITVAGNVHIKTS